MAVGIRPREKDGETKPTRWYSSRQEKTVADSIDGTPTSNSGATDFGGKGDVITKGAEGILIECKTKTSPSKSISIQKAWIEKNRQEMVFMGKKHQAIAFNFGPGEENHYIIDEYLFQELLKYLKETSND